MKWTSSYKFEKTSVNLQQKRINHLCWEIDNGVLLLGGKSKCWVLDYQVFKTCQAFPPLKQLSLWLVMVPPLSQDLTSFTRPSKLVSESLKKDFSHKYIEDFKQS